MWMEGIIFFIAVEAIVELWKKAAPLQGMKRWSIRHTHFLYSIENDTHLMECPYCMSAWIGFIVLVSYFVCRESLYVFSVFAIHRLSNHFHLLFSIARDAQLDMRARRRKL